MKVMYWVTASNISGTVNFSITGEGSVEEECKIDAERKIQERIPFKSTHLHMQKFYSLEKDLDENS